MPAGRLDRMLDRDDDLLAGRLDGRVGDLGQRAAVHVRRGPVDEVLLQELARDEADAAGLVDVERGEAAARA